MSKFPKFINRTALTAAVCLCAGSCVIPAPSAQAFDLGVLGTVIEAGAEYQQLNSQLNYLDGKGRNQYLEQVEKQVGVNQDERANAMLSDVMKRLSASVATTDPSINQKPYNYFVNNDTSFNAFCTLGHNMSVNIGLFNELNYNEDEVAFVVGHEMGHGQKNHPVAGVKRQFPLQVLASVASSSGGIAGLGATIAAKVGSAKLITKPMEVEADKLGFQYAVGASYNPGAGAALWQRILDKVGPGGNTSGAAAELFNDHPATVSRRNTYNEDITKWSNGNVKVNADTGTIFLKGKDLYTPAAMNGMSSKERAYLVAGNLAAVYHNSKNPSGPVSVNGSNQVYVGQQYIVTPVDNAAAEQLKSKLEKNL